MCTNPSFFHPFIHPPIHKTIYLFIYSSFHTYIHLFIHPSIHPSIYPSIHLCICLSIHPVCHVYPCLQGQTNVTSVSLFAGTDKSFECYNTYFGVPNRILSDRGAEFPGREWEGLLNILGIKRHLTSPYYPQGKLFINPSIYSSIHPSIHVPIHLFFHPSIYP